MFRPCGERICNFKTQKSSLFSNVLRIFDFDNDLFQYFQKPIYNQVKHLFLWRSFYCKSSKPLTIFKKRSIIYARLDSEISAKTCVQSCRREKMLRTRNCRHKCIKYLLPENAKKTCKPNNRDLNGH